MKYPNFLATCIILHNICSHSLLCWKGRGEKNTGCTHFSINICSKDRKVFCTHPVYKSDYIMLINWRNPNSLSPMSQCICLSPFPLSNCACIFFRFSCLPTLWMLHLLPCDSAGLCPACGLVLNSNLLSNGKQTKMLAFSFLAFH